MQKKILSLKYTFSISFQDILYMCIFTYIYIHISFSNRLLDKETRYVRIPHTLTMYIHYTSSISIEIKPVFSLPEFQVAFSDSISVCDYDLFISRGVSCMLCMHLCVTYIHYNYMYALQPSDIHNIVRDRARVKIVLRVFAKRKIHLS